MGKYRGYTTTTSKTIKKVVVLQLFDNCRTFLEERRELIVRFISGQNIAIFRSFGVRFVPYFQMKLLYLSRKEKNACGYYPQSFRTIDSVDYKKSNAGVLRTK